ncbi:MAG: glycosyltransferase family 39 protein [Carboxylicivirga sp.]|nr:glycosyltransferase family 39 protein [Carboxylicivirga sp.]MCT4645185.1 glycosyltransferase family 39 protein [Carboxylicivirga sp.]
MNKIFQRKEYVVICIFVLVKLVIHVITNMNAGLDGDEILHIESGNHPAWGYMSIQPLIGFFGWIQNLFDTESVFIHHLFAHIGSILIVILSGLTVIQLGGSWKATLLTLTSILVAPGFTLTHHLFTPLVFEQFFWLLSFYILILYCKQNQPKHLIYLAVFFALGFMAKISILIFIAGVGISILFYKRELFIQKISWIALVVFLLIILPNFIWQYQHNFPFVRHMIALHSKVLVNINVVDNWNLLFLTTNPFTVFVWGTAILFAPFVKYTKNIRMAVVAILFSFIILVVFKGQFYYYFPTLLIAFCVGSVIIESFLKSKIILLWIYIPILTASGVFLTPKVLPILTLEKYIEYLSLDNEENIKNKQLFFTQQSITDNKTVNKGDRIPINFEGYYTYNDWENLTQTINDIYQCLPNESKKNCYIWTRCYTQASAINVYGRKYNLPQAFSQHGNCYEWIPTFDTNATIIVIANAESPADSIKIGSFFASSFKKLTWKNAVFCPYSRTSSNAFYMFYLGEELKYNSDTIKSRYKDYIFE